MNKGFYVKEENGKYTAWHNDVCLGDIVMAEDGFYVFFPTKGRGGFWDEKLFFGLYKILHELNKPWEACIREDFSTHAKKNGTVNMEITKLGSEWSASIRDEQISEVGATPTTAIKNAVRELERTPDWAKTHETYSIIKATMSYSDFLDKD